MLIHHPLWREYLFLTLTVTLCGREMPAVRIWRLRDDGYGPSIREFTCGKPWAILTPSHHTMKYTLSLSQVLVLYSVLEDSLIDTICAVPSGMGTHSYFLALYLSTSSGHHHISIHCSRCHMWCSGVFTIDPLPSSSAVST